MSDYKDFLIENNDKIVGSFICPVMDKYDLIPFWIASLKRFSCPERFKIIVVDSRGGGWIERCGEEILKLGFGKVKFVVFQQDKSSLTTLPKETLNKSSLVSDTFKRALPYIEGDIVIGYEDDIEFGEGAVEFLIKTLYKYSDIAHRVSALTFEKKDKNNTRLVAKTKEGNNIYRIFSEDAEECEWSSFGLYATFANYISGIPCSIMEKIGLLSIDVGYDKLMSKYYGLKTYLANVGTIHRYNSSIAGGFLTKCKVNDLKFYKIKDGIKNGRGDIKKPTFIISMGGRTGSTWIQRVINSTEEAFIYGESEEILDKVIDYVSTLWIIQEKTRYKSSFDRFKRMSHKGFYPSLLPFLEWDALLEFRKQIEAIFKRDENNGWGFKTICLTPQLLFLLSTAFPEANYIFLIRNKEQQYKSYKETGWWKNDSTFDKWENINIYKLKMYDFLKHHRNTLFIRYEDVKDGSLVNVLSEFYDIAPEKFKKDVLYAKAKS
jgi:hypothetical protein